MPLSRRIFVSRAAFWNRQLGPAGSHCLDPLYRPSLPRRSLPAPSVSPLELSGPVSFLLVPPSKHLVVSYDGPVVMPGGVECCDVEFGLRRGKTTWDWPSLKIHSRLMRAKWTDGLSIRPPHGLSSRLPLPTSIATHEAKWLRACDTGLSSRRAQTTIGLMRDRHALHDLRAVAADGKNHWASSL